MLEATEQRPALRLGDAEGIAFPDQATIEFLTAEPGLPRRHATAAIGAAERAGQDFVGAFDRALGVEGDRVDAARQMLAIRNIDPAAVRFGEYSGTVRIGMPAEIGAGNDFAGAADDAGGEASRQQ